MPANAREVDGEAMTATVLQFHDVVPASQVVQVVTAYEAAKRRRQLMKNPRVMALAKLPVGGNGIPWPYPLLKAQRSDHVYLQTTDRVRAQEVLRDPKAKWEIYFSTQTRLYGQVRVRRVR